MRQTKRTSDYYHDIYETHYDRFARVFDPFTGAFFFVFNGGFGGERRWRQQIVDWIDPRRGERILDICSGTGTLAIMLAKRLAGEGEVVGVELSAAQLRVARRKRQPNGPSFIQGDARTIPFPDSSFDKGVICGALHEMPEGVRKNVLSEAHRVIRPGGRMVVVEHNEPDKSWKACLFDFMERLNPEYSTYRDLLSHGLTNEITQAQFRIIKSDTNAWDYFQIVLAER